MSRRALVLLAVLLGVAAEARAGDWTSMMHGWAFLTSNRQGGASGDQDFESQNHLMVVSSRPAGAWSMSLLGTFSAEPMTIPPQGSPLLFQRGETYNDVLLVDRQHPHDLFVQLAAEWSRSLAKSGRLRLYAAPVGEPAVGPTAYVHRRSSSANPMAPLAHHNQDSTHISADVLTGDYDFGPVRVEASLFHGREPDENRWDIDQGKLDSYSGRLSFEPLRGLMVQISAARREEPEAIEEGNQTRQTASLEYERSLSTGFVAASLIAGRNLLEGGQVEWGNLLEGVWKFSGKDTVYGRAESVDRDLFELVNKTARPDTAPPQRVAVRALTLGYLRDLPLFSEAATSLGAGVTFYRFDDRLDATYGEDPVSAQVFLKLGFGTKGAPHHH